MFKEYDDILQLRNSVSLSVSSTATFDDNSRPLFSDISSKTWENAADRMKETKVLSGIIAAYSGGLGQPEIAVPAGVVSIIANEFEEFMIQQAAEAKKKEEERNRKLTEEILKEKQRDEVIKREVDTMLERNRDYMNSREFLRDYRDMPDQNSHENMC